MSNVYIGNSIVYHHSGLGIPGIPYVNPPPLRVHYINERVGSFAMF